ncbi:MAG: hypothetical protein ACE5F8_04895 [Woeseiaceae bacterium]
MTDNILYKVMFMSQGQVYEIYARKNVFGVRKRAPDILADAREHSHRRGGQE